LQAASKSAFFLQTSHGHAVFAILGFADSQVLADFPLGKSKKDLQKE